MPSMPKQLNIIILLLEKRSTHCSNSTLGISGPLDPFQTFPGTESMISVLFNTEYTLRTPRTRKDPSETRKCDSHARAVINVAIFFHFHIDLYFWYCVKQ